MNFLRSEERTKTVLKNNLNNPYFLYVQSPEAMTRIKTHWASYFAASN